MEHITNDDLELVRQIVTIVEPFRLMTDKLQADGVTISLILPGIRHLISHTKVSQDFLAN
jgi:hypothetical protein